MGIWLTTDQVKNSDTKCNVLELLYENTTDESSMYGIASMYDLWVVAKSLCDVAIATF